MWHRRLMPSMHVASSRPFPSMRRTWAYSGRNPSIVKSLREQVVKPERVRSDPKLVVSIDRTGESLVCRLDQLGSSPCPSSLKMSSRFSSLSFFPTGPIIRLSTARRQKPYNDHLLPSMDVPRLLFLPPFPAITGAQSATSRQSTSDRQNQRTGVHLCSLA